MEEQSEIEIKLKEASEKTFPITIPDIFEAHRVGFIEGVKSDTAKQYHNSVKDSEGIKKQSKKRYVDFIVNGLPITEEMPSLESPICMKDNKIELLEEDLKCIHMYLDDLKVRRVDKFDNTLSIVGRIKELNKL